MVKLKYVGREKWIARSDKFLEPGEVIEVSERDAASLTSRYKTEAGKPAFEPVKAKKAQPKKEGAE